MIPVQELDKIVKELSKKSTAPDKETPDWMESDIRRGVIAGYKYAQSEEPTRDALRVQFAKERHELLEIIKELKGQ